MTTEKIEIVYPDDSFAQFGGHVIERLFQTRAEMRDLGKKRYRVRVTIETFPLGESGALIGTAIAPGIGTKIGDDIDAEDANA